MNPKPLLFIQPHLGLGDAIVCCGLVRELAKANTVVWPCRWPNLDSVKEMFADLREVVVFPVSNDDDARKLVRSSEAQAVKVLRLGIHSGQALATQWDKQMYEQADVPFEKRWDSFVAPKCEPLLECSRAFPFLHQDESRGLRITKGLVADTYYVPQRTHSIFSHLNNLQIAPEIHVIDSSFLCLADSVPTTAKRLVFHKYARPGGRPPTLRKAWEVLA